MKRRTMRGILTGGELRRLVVDDGNFNHGYKVTEFHVFATSFTGNRDCQAVLGLDYDMVQSFNASDNRQIGWGSQANGSGTDGTIGTFSLIDPDHVVIRDLYVANFGSDDANYLVILEPITLNNDQAILTLIKERSQDDLR